MLEYDFDKSVGFWVCLTSQAMRRRLNERLEEGNITLRQWEVLAALAVNPELSQCQLADVMGIEPPTLAGVINRMERDGWLVRQPHADDRRRRRLVPTAQAEAIWQTTSRWCQEIREQAVRGISEEELAKFKRTCEIIRENLGGTDPRACEEDVPCEGTFDIVAGSRVDTDPEMDAATDVEMHTTKR